MSHRVPKDDIAYAHTLQTLHASFMTSTKPIGVFDVPWTLDLIQFALGYSILVIAFATKLDVHPVLELAGHEVLLIHITQWELALPGLGHRRYFQPHRHVSVVYGRDTGFELLALLKLGDAFEDVKHVSLPVCFVDGSIDPAWLDFDFDLDAIALVVFKPKLAIDNDPWLEAVFSLQDEAVKLSFVREIIECLPLISEAILAFRLKHVLHLMDVATTLSSRFFPIWHHLQCLLEEIFFICVLILLHSSVVLEDLKDSLHRFRKTTSVIGRHLFG
mmetsp:Transcript_46985/g.111845  ORF Transcript_46985/g.111845 Transcript_46985/m.111845 type:complete len:274 (-) Transcript_46985:2559-3380(-)